MKCSRVAWSAVLAVAPLASACGSSGDRPRDEGVATAPETAATTTGSSAGGASGAAVGSVGGSGAGIGSTASGAGGGTLASTSASTSGDAGGSGSDALGAYPFEPSPVTRGGTMTFTNVGARGSWPRRLDRDEGDPACDYKDGTDTWGGHCCMTLHETSSTSLSPFDEEMTLIVKALDIKQLAVYQPAQASSWQRTTAWDARNDVPENLWFTQEGGGGARFPGNLTRNDCVGYVMQEPTFDCTSGEDYYCPDDPGVLHQGFSGSKLVVFLASMNFDDAAVSACDGGGQGHPGPWVAFVASELVRDGGRKWNGLCNCYTKTDSVGDGCGEINVFEVVMDDNEYSNREFMSTGVRSYQEGHVGGAVCGADCERDAFAEDVEVVDACAGTAYEAGPVLEVGGQTDGCPVWRRPDGDRYFFILLDESERMIQVAVIHPDNIPSPARDLLPDLPRQLPRTAIDALLEMRLPS